MQLRRMLVFILAFWMVATLIPTSASAQEPTIGGFRLRVEQLTDSTTGPGVVIKDEINEGLGGQVGYISFFGAFGNVDNSFTSGTSKPNPDFPTTFLAEMLLTNFLLTSTGAATVRLTLEDTGFAFQSGPLQVTNIITLFSLSAGTTVTTQAWIGALPPDMGHLQDSPGTLDAMPTILDANALTMSTAAVGSSVTNYLQGAGKDALFTQVKIVFGAEGGSVGFNQVTTVAPGDGGLVEGVPEPGSLLLIATGVMGLGGRMRRRRMTRG